MPGLLGIATRERPSSASAPFRRMFEPAVRAFAHESLEDPHGRWALGRTHLGVLQPGAQLDGQGATQVVLHGDLHETQTLRARLELQGPAGDAALIAAAYERLGDGFVDLVHGVFCLAVVDTRRRRVLLLSDPVGSYPLYWVATAEGLVFASELAAVLRHPAVSRSLDPRAVADYIAFGMPLGSKTLAAGVQLLPAGTLLAWDGTTGEVRLRTVSDLATTFSTWTGSRREYEEAVCDQFAKAVERSTAGDHALGLSLSGGLDSRAILSALNGHRGAVATYTLGVKGCADEVIAASLARMAGTRHRFFELDDRYLREFLPNLARMVSLTDGMYLSHGLTEMLALHFLETVDFRVLVRGHGGELAKTDLAWPLHTDDHVRTLQSAPQLAQYVRGRLNYIRGDVALSDVFTARWTAATDGAAEASLDEALAGVTLGPPDLCSYLYLTQHHRRCTVASLELFRQAVEVRLPFVDVPFLRVLLAGRPEWRADTSLHRAITRAGDAALLRVRNSNTGAPGDAGPLTERVLDKFNSLMKRLNVRGYRHYHNFQAWMEAQLLASVEELLLSRGSLDRGVLKESGVRRLLDETRQGRGNHSYLLQVLLILELWQRENL